MKTKQKQLKKRIMAFCLMLSLIAGIFQAYTPRALAAGNISVTGMGRHGSIQIGDHTKSNTWWNIRVSGNDAFCLSLGKHCHNGLSYSKTETKTWTNETTGEKASRYSRILRWYVIDKKRSKSAKLMSQALVWAVASGLTSKSELKNIIKQMQTKGNVLSSSDTDTLYTKIFEPDDAWTVTVSYWEKNGSTAGYQKLMTVDAQSTAMPYEPKTLTKTDLYHQRIAIHKKDELGKPLSGIEFTLKVENGDELYSFSSTGASGLTKGSASDSDEDDDTEFELTETTRTDGCVFFRMTYKIQCDDEKYYYSDSDLAAMSSSDKADARSHLEDELELEEGVDFAHDLTKASAETLAENDLLSVKQKIDNKYTLIEESVGDNKDIYLDPTLHAGIDFNLDSENSWFRDDNGNWPEDTYTPVESYPLVFHYNVDNIYKKATVNIKKIDSYSDDKATHGDATLDGAQFTLYDDEQCTTKATVYDKDGNPKEVGTYVTSTKTVDGKKVTGFDTDYLISGKTYYLKEIVAPEGYLLSNTVTPITADASEEVNLTTDNITDLTITNQPILGKVAIQKYYNDDNPGLLYPEDSVSFQVYLKSAGSFANAHEKYERDLLITDKNGYACTHALYYGTYIVHQIDTGSQDTIKVDDFEMKIDENGKTYTYPLRNPFFRSYLKIVKKDKNTEHTVLKPGTTYKIYKVENGKETIVQQTYSDGNKIKTVDTFVTDVTGEIVTVKELFSGTYRIYETDAVSGYRLAKKYFEIEINSHLQNYTVTTDANGDKHAVVVIEFENEETIGKFGLKKFGKFLKSYDTTTHSFLYEDRALKGVTFEVYADGDIATQDANPTTWFKDGELVATIKAGESAEFTSKCGGITSTKTLADGTVELTLPLGKYIVKEKETPYGYVISDKQWHLEFMWQSQNIDTVLNVTDDTDDTGVLNITNDVPSISITTTKKDKDSGEGIANTTFGLYTKTDIYNADGQMIVRANELIDTFTTDATGTYVYEKTLPCMDKGYGIAGYNGSNPVSSATPTASTTPIINANGKNSGDYFIKELLISGSYYPDKSEKNIHLEYMDARTVILEANADFVDKQTDVNISKRIIAGSDELLGAQLKITDKEGSEIVSWTSGNADSISFSPILGASYQNLKADIAENQSIIIKGLLHDVEYTLTEVRPADGYVTAEDIDFIITQGEDGDSSVVAIKDAETDSDVGADATSSSDDGSASSGSANGTGTTSDSGTGTSNGTSTINLPAGYHFKNNNQVVMYDEETHVLITKVDAETGKSLAGAVIEIYDGAGELVDTVTSSEDGVLIDGQFIVDDIYTFKEVSAPKGYKISKEVKFGIEDTADLQEVIIKDEKAKKATHIPQTGMPTPPNTTGAGLNLVMCLALMMSVISYIRRRRQIGNKTTR